MSKRILRIVSFVALALVLVQSLSFYAIGDIRLLNATGKNYKTFVLNQNTFSGITLVSDLDLDVEVVKKNFKQFGEYDVALSDDFENPFAPIPENRYEYIIKNETKNPFKINNILEIEHAPEYGASFKSSYIWILFDWVLIKKENTGIS